MRAIFNPDIYTHAIVLVVMLFELHSLNFFVGDETFQSGAIGFIVQAKNISLLTQGLFKNK
jgi:hypothetical protein